jgi:nitroreductase
MESFWDVIQRRRSIRHFKSDSVPREIIEKCISAANIAPSGGNQKNWRFIVVQSSEKMEQLQKIVEARIYTLQSSLKSARAKKEFESYSLRYFTFFADAPAVICVVMRPYDSLTARILNKLNPDASYQTSAGIQSVAAATENLLLAATSFGLGTCWMTGPLIACDELQKRLGIADPESLVALVPMGYPVEEPLSHKLKKDVDDIIEWI